VAKVASCNANFNKKGAAKKTNYDLAKLNKLQVNFYIIIANLSKLKLNSISFI